MHEETKTKLAQEKKLHLEAVEAKLVIEASFKAARRDFKARLDRATARVAQANRTAAAANTRAEMAERTAAAKERKMRAEERKTAAAHCTIAELDTPATNHAGYVIAGDLMRQLLTTALGKTTGGFNRLNTSIRRRAVARCFSTCEHGFSEAGALAEFVRSTLDGAAKWNDLCRYLSKDELEELVDDCVDVDEPTTAVLSLMERFMAYNCVRGEYTHPRGHAEVLTVLQSLPALTTRLSELWAESPEASPPWLQLFRVYCDELDRHAR